LAWQPPVIITNSGTISGGAAGAANTGGHAGVAGAGIVGSSLTIHNNGTISGGNNGAVNAITFTGGTNFLDLNPNSTQGTLIGNIAVTGSVTFNQAQRRDVE
jgi:hypothetical protein